MNNCNSAEQTECWIERIIQSDEDAGRFNLCEFRSNVFCEVAREQYDCTPDEHEQIHLAIRETLAAWLMAGRFDCPSTARDEKGESQLLIQPEELTVPERRDALRMAIRHLRPSAEK